MTSFVRRDTASLVMTRGDTFIFRVTLTDENNDPIDLTNTTWRMDARHRFDDPSPVFSLSSGTGIEFVDGDPLLGIAEITIPPADTADLSNERQKLLVDVQYTTPGGDIFTVVRETLLVLAEVTQP